jgi:hypothetical protein
MPLTYGGGSRAWDPAAKAVVFPAMDGKTTVRCMVTADALAFHFGMAKAEELDALRAFDRARMVIEEKAASKYARGRLTAPGEVTVGKRDFE